MPGLRDRLTDAGYGLGWSVVCRLPESWAQRGFRFAADLAWRRQGPGVRVLEGNLRRVIGSQAPGGELRALSRQAMRSYARYWLEAFRLPVTPAGRLIGGVHDTGHIRAAFEYLAAGRGVVFALPHMGNYDLAGAWVIAKGAGSVTTVAERVKPESVYGRFVAFREGLGVEVLPASGGTSSAFGVLAQRLRAGKLVCLVCDRDVTGTGMEVEFFGEKARMTGGPAALAVQTGAALTDFLPERWRSLHSHRPQGRESVSEYSTSCIGIRTAEVLISAESDASAWSLGLARWRRRSTGGGCQVPPGYMAGRSGSPARSAGRCRAGLAGNASAPSACGVRVSGVGG